MESYISKIRSKIGHELLMAPAVVGRIANNKGEILLVQNRASSSWSIPGGYVEPEETIEQAIVRELEEETGYIVKPIRLIGIYSTPQYDIVYPNGDKVHPITFYFDCEVVDQKAVLDEDEIGQAKFFANDAIPQMAECCMQKVKDGARANAALIIS